MSEYDFIKNLLYKDPTIYDKDLYNREVYRKELEPLNEEYMQLYGPVAELYEDDVCGGYVHIICNGKLPPTIYWFFSEFIKSPECNVFLLTPTNFKYLMDIQIKKCIYQDYVYIIPLCFSKKYISKLKTFKIKVLCYLHIFDANIKNIFKDNYKVLEFEIHNFTDSHNDGEKKMMQKIIKNIKELHQNNDFFQFAKNILPLHDAFHLLKS